MQLSSSSTGESFLRPIRARASMAVRSQGSLIGSVQQNLRGCATGRLILVSKQERIGLPRINYPRFEAESVLREKTDDPQEQVRRRADFRCIPKGAWGRF